MKRSKIKRLGDSVMGICVDCRQPCLARDFYIVRSAIWIECGMGAYNAGYLHLECLEKRLGRELTDDDLLMWLVDENSDELFMEASPDYLKSPEYLQGSSRYHGSMLAAATARQLNEHGKIELTVIESDIVAEQRS